ncbi:MAG: rhomboid family intramembrane serine protease [Candidatus Latescibacterota bacterium]|nr:MAG: rhomboid family intramembrane serine protease [Candidatus Latescibacterota bacterium]
MHESDRPQLPEDVVEFLHAFYGATPRLVVTPLLVGVNVAVFLAMVLSGAHPLMPSAETLLRWGANYGTALNEGESWRLLTCMFVHVGVIHVAVNMYALWASGSVLERLTGNYGFLLLYLLSGLVGSLNSTLWHMESFRVSAGASGAVFGVFGGLLGFLIPQRGFVPGIIYRRLLRVVGFVVVGNLVFGALVSFIDNAAHLGGFLSGLLLGFVLSHRLEPEAIRLRSRRNSIAALLGFAALVAGTVLASQMQTPLQRAIAHLDQREYLAALDEMDALIAEDPDEVRAYLVRGTTYMLMQEYEAAVDDLTIAIEMSPGFVDAYLSRASAYRELGELDEALEDCDRAIDMAPRNWGAYHTRGHVLFLRNNDDAATEDWRRAAELTENREDQAGSLENIGLVYLRRGDWREAFEHSREVDAVHDQMAWNALFQAIAADQLGMSDAATSAYARWVTLREPTDVEQLRPILPSALLHYLEKEAL